MICYGVFAAGIAGKLDRTYAMHFVATPPTSPVAPGDYIVRAKMKALIYSNDDPDAPPVEVELDRKDSATFTILPDGGGTPNS